MRRMANSRSMRSALIASAALLAIAGVELIYYYPLIGDVAASHFDYNGAPNGYQNKAMFFATWILVLGLFMLVGFVVPALLNRVPTALLNLPNKDYWFAPERRTQTLRRFADHFAWFGVAGLALVVAIMNVAMRANLATGQQLAPTWFWLPLAVFLVFFIWWVARLLAMFRLPA